MPLSEKLKKIIKWATKRHAPRQPGRPTVAQLDELRRQATAELERAINEPLSAKAKMDLATLELLDATKH